MAAMIGCPPDTGPGNTNEPEPGVNGDGGVGPGPGVNPIDLGCSEDGDCGAGEICDATTGECVAGFDCSQNPTICAFCGEPGTDCGFDGEGYCDQDAGVCRRSKQQCDACTVDAECGEGPNFENKCVDGYCAAGCGPCPAGFQCQDGGCIPVPSAGSCETAISCREGEACPDGQRCSDLGICLSICENDGECPAGQICSLDPGPLLGTCINGCPARDTIQTGGGTQICHANGRYGPLCTRDGDCVGGLVCEIETGFCQSPGCQTSQDCPLVRTYCDTATGECVEGCLEADDCAAFELCEEGACVQQGCRGKDVSCGLGQWCCGQEAFADASTCPADVEDGSCFIAPEPWCQTCEDDNDCAGIDAFGYASYCYELQEEDDQGNTVTLGKFCSVGCNSNADCPRGIQCILELPTPTEGETTQGCLDSRCAPLVEARDNQ